MPRREEFWAAGVYIRESKIAIVLGEVVFSDVPRIGPAYVPQTRRRAEIKLDEVDCEGKLPEEALREAAEQISQRVNAAGVNLRAVHVACFGGFLSTRPQDKRLVRRPVYGVLTNVSAYSEAWGGLNVYRAFIDVFRLYGLKAEVNVGTNADAAAFGEFLYECKHLRGQALARYVRDTTLVCLNFSRTINIGIMRRGDLWAGENHPLLSIIRPPRFTTRNGRGGTWFDLYEGNCPYHKDCIEGLIGVKALEERTELPFFDIPDDHEVWETVAYYIAQACIAVVSVLMPTTIVLTGRCVRQIDGDDFSEKILRRIRGHFYSRLSDDSGHYSPAYLDPAVLDPDEFIRLPRRPKRKNSNYRKGGLPGRHGAIRLSAREVHRLEA